jgi:uncharacterized protein YjbI with pentapeptide repeats
MQNRLTNFIEKCQNVKPLEIRNQEFFNELIFDYRLSAAIFDEVTMSNFKFEETDFLSSHFRKCFFKNCDFQNIVWRKCEFLECTFHNCYIRDSEISKVELTDHTFNSCQFDSVDLDWSHIQNCEFLKTKLNGLNFNATIVSDLKIN